MSVYAALSEEECYLWAILSDPSGIDQMEFMIHDSAYKIQEKDGSVTQGLFRAWPFQVAWWRDRNPLVISQGSRCISEDTPVLTEYGWCPIQEVQVGDLVLTHKGRWRRVTEVFDNGVKDVVAVYAQGTPFPTYMTPDHLILARNARRASGPKDGHKRAKMLDHVWLSPQDWVWSDGSQVLTSRYASPAAADPLPFIRSIHPIGRQRNKVDDVLDLDWLWLVGLFISEGCATVHSNGMGTVRWSLHQDEVDTVTAYLDRLDLVWHIQKQPDNGETICISSTSISQWFLDNIGHGAKNKNIPTWVFGLSESERQAVFDGICFGDGWTRSNGRIDHSTSSYNLVLDLRLLAHSLGYSFSTSHTKAFEGQIEGRKIWCSDSWSSGIQKIDASGNSNRTTIDGIHAWVGLRKLEPYGKMNTWDLEVEEDHSFVANGMVVHNSAGKSLSCCAAALAFPFCYPGEEMVITAPENVHLQALTDKIETMYVNNRVPKEMLVRGVHGIKHKPYLQNFSNGARIMGRIPQRDGRGVKGVHPAVLLLDEACFTGDTLILTERGQVPIKDVLVGDRVLTHKGNWKRVLGNYDKGEREVVSVKGQGHWGLRCTPNHHFWGKRILDWHDRKNQHGMKEVSEFTWIPADELENAALWASPMTVPWEGEVPTTIQSKRGDISILTTDFMWCLGLYAAEGSTSSSYGSGGKENKSTWSIHVNEVTEVVDRLRQAGLAPLVQPVQNTANCMNVVCCGVDLAGFLDEHIGVGCYNKKVPGWVYGLSSELRSAFFEGVMYGDGCKSYDARYTHVRDRLSTTSRLLAVGVKLLALSLGKFVSIHYREGGSCSIRGKMFTSGPSWEVVTNDSGQGLTDEGVRLTKVKHVRIDGLERVYDLEVEDDHSFIADGIIVHNSDYPELAWNELIETVNQSSENAQWKAFGVTRGVRDKFYEYTTSDNWKVYRLPAMFRPTWSDEERAAKVAQYGSEDNVDYRRNILGVHSDAASPLFSAMQLGRCFIGETQVSVIVEDERLEAGHHIALTPISDVSIGDVVLNAVGSGTVINKIVSEHDEIYEIRVQGESIYGTGDHPVFTRRGWVPIRELTPDDEIVTRHDLSALRQGVQFKEPEVLLQRLLVCLERGEGQVL